MTVEDRAKLTAGLLVEREAARLAGEAEERARVLALPPAAANALVREFGVRRVVAFGSLVWSERFHSRSDVDLAVEGIAPDRFFEAWSRLERLVGRSIDLIALESCPELLRARILREGRALGAL
ncbi:MAG: nucleotidyltransferase domain-containing protein [Myxococcota bacterium]